MVQWLRLVLTMEWAWGQSLDRGTKIPHALEHGQEIKKKRNNATCSNMNGPRDYHTK